MIGLALPGWLEAVLELLFGVAFFLGFAAFVGWLILRIGSPWLDRSNAMLARDQAGADRYGWLPDPAGAAMLRWAGSRCFRHDGKLYRPLTGEYQGRRIRMGEYVYFVRSRYYPTKNVGHVIAIELPVHLPELVVSRQPLLEPELLSFDAESEAFNRQYYVASPAHRYTSAVLHPRMMECLLAHPELSFRIIGNQVVAYAPTPWTVPQTLATVPALSRVADLIPPFVLKDFAVAPPVR
ncbi:hypothetical protein FB561_5839 [Kribbella amoyensis]|uniref:Uncharacterized protein n=1 Tax=Kribbella amoyensis TaxID=996641 RepID=A0A561C0G9_9ACTN|nr:hypothetical protein [Kribbella amoyensis]TWD84645.1 hypothetical protein FB561_5839 [Kribbella amoyensis]